VDALDAARQVKHSLFVRKKQAKFAFYRLRTQFEDYKWDKQEESNPYRYDASRYPHTFIARPPLHCSNDRPVDRVIYAIWLGDPMNARRRQSLESLVRWNPNIPVRMITEKNLDDYVLSHEPLHPAYRYLSVVHKSDYIRTYLMHHYGGGYSDIKTATHGWSESFLDLEENARKWAVGYREITSTYTPDLPRGLGRDLKRHYRAVFGTSAFIVRPGTSFTGEWYRELLNRMNYFEEALSEMPAHNAYSADPAYPIRWTEILGDIFQPLCLKYQDRLVHDDRIKPVLSNYR
jgi:hypothetical protein